MEARLKSRVFIPPNFTIVGKTPQIEQLRKTIALVASAREVTVLITGESGVGKELVARNLHSQSRRPGRFVELNCSAIPEGLVESELFGHNKGAFTGAIRDHKGKFVLAEDGTLFLDEIGDMPLTTQAKLLRVLEYHSFSPVGSSETLTSNAHVIAATNKDLADEIQKRRFRGDLHSRLNEVEIHVPPLREHVDDIPLLVAHFLDKFNLSNDRSVEVSREALFRIMEIAPTLFGNIRDLSALVKRAAVFAETGVILPDNPAFKSTVPIIRVERTTERKSDVVTEESIRQAIRKIGPFKIVLHAAKIGSETDCRRTIERVADAHSTTPSQVFAVLTSNGIDMRNLIQEERRSLMLAVLAQNLPPVETAQALGVTTSTISHHARKLGIRMRTRSVVVLATV